MNRIDPHQYAEMQTHAPRALGVLVEFIIIAGAAALLAISIGLLVVAVTS